jgi:hypothetical protein
MALVEECSGSLSCTVSSTVNGIDHTTGALDRVDGRCYWTNTSPDDGSIHNHELLPDGTVDGHDSWKSDGKHLVVTFGGGGLVFDCQ